MVQVHYLFKECMNEYNRFFIFIACCYWKTMKQWRIGTAILNKGGRWLNKYISKWRPMECIICMHQSFKSKIKSAQNNSLQNNSLRVMMEVMWSLNRSQLICYYRWPWFPLGIWSLHTIYSPLKILQWTSKHLKLIELNVRHLCAIKIHGIWLNSTRWIDQDDDIMLVNDVRNATLIKKIDFK